MTVFQEELLICVKSGEITMDEYSQLNNCNLMNIQQCINILTKLTKLTTTLSKLTNSVNLNNLSSSFYNNHKDLLKYKDDKLIFKNKIVLDRIIKKSNLNYTEDQQNAINNMIRFFTNPTEKYFGLFGYAGTGKTTTIIDFLMNCIELKYINSLIFTAPTNKALNVIKTKISDRIKYLLNKHP